MKTEIEKLLKENYKNLPQEKIAELADKMCEVLPSPTVKLSEVKVGNKFKFKGYEFTKLADEDKSCYCLLNDIVFENEFGKTNDWAKSPIRMKLNEFDMDGNSYCLPNINRRDLVSVSLNYYAYKIPNGRTTDRITLPSWEEYITYGFSPINKSAWLRSGNDNYARSAVSLDSSGGSYGACTFTLAVRPALHLKSGIEVEE